MQRLTVIFRKGEGARFLSHLDLAATFEYAVRRAQLPVVRSEGFNPRPRLSLATALPLGYVGEGEILEVVLSEPVPEHEVAVRLQAALPVGIQIRSVSLQPEGTKVSGARLKSAVYRITLAKPQPGLPERVASLLHLDSILIEEVHNEKTRLRDVRPLILALEATSPQTLRLHVQLDGGGSVRPEPVLRELHLSSEDCQITRESIELD